MTGVPQRLKPDSFLVALYGTAEAVPFPVKVKVEVKVRLRISDSIKVKGDGQECPSHTCGGIAATGELHRSFVGSRSLRGRLRFLRMTA